jgi:hypothetical protein
MLKPSRSIVATLSPVAAATARLSWAWVMSGSFRNAGEAGAAGRTPGRR